MSENRDLRIGFIRSGVNPEHVLAYKGLLNNYDIQTFAVCETCNEYREYDESIKVYCFEIWLQKRWNKISAGDLLQYQKRYAWYNLWEVYYTDRYMRFKYNYSDACRLIVGALSFWEYVYKDSKAGYIVSDCIIGAHNFYGMIVGERFNVNYISIQSGRYKKYYSYFSLKEGYESVEFDQLNNSNAPVTADEIRFVKDYIEEYTGKNQHPEYIHTSINATRKIRKTAGFYLKRIKNISYLWDKKFDNKYNTKLYKGKWTTLDPAKEAVRGKCIKKFLKNPNPDEKYVLYPLHFQPEASTCVYARKYENQLYFIEQLAKSVPAGLMIYVKEHMVRQGHRPLSFYRALEKYPNVKLINPEYSGHELIKKSEYLICLTSTMGFEALMYGKPVFVCGDCFFEGFSGVTRIHDIFDEKNKLNHPPVQDRALYMKQMAYYFRTLHLCTTQEQPMNDEDAEGLADVRKQTVDELVLFIDKNQKGSVQCNSKN